MKYRAKVRTKSQSENTGFTDGLHRKVWNDQSGKIIFSDNDSATYALNGENIEKWSHAALSNEDMLKKAIKGV